MRKLLFITFATLGVLLSAGVSANAADKAAVGYLYTTLNGEGENAVVRFSRYKNGTIGDETAFWTGSKGGANRGAGGDAFGDFDSQNAINIIDNYLLAVNAGGHDVTVFSINHASGNLKKIANVASGGERPVTITSQPVAGSNSKYWVVVGNQWNNPNVQKGGAGEPAIERYPNDAFIKNGHKSKVAARNIALFSFDTKTGALILKSVIDSYTGTNGGPTAVDFSPNGKSLAVATWGIAHFGTATPSLKEQKPSRVYVYDFNAKTGATGNRRFYEEAGIAGSIGMDWAPNSVNLLVTNFNLTVEKRDHSVTVLGVSADSVSKVQNFGTGDGAGDVDEACWMLVNPAGDKAYASSFGTNVISVFDLDKRGRLKKIGRGKETVNAARAKGTPAGDTKDMFIVDKDFYVIGAYQTYTLSHYSIKANGTLKLVKQYDVDTATEDSGPGTYNFLGLAGYSIN
ncbi:MAG: hypothetical protein K0U45_00695 [Alphaproteobacteria bacterium]|nr:hypothetical protein [Alphaproteobacteria bacterium]